MVILLSGASHTGKTRLAQQLMEHLHIPYLSIDHLKMGLIRSGQTTLTPTDDQQLTDYLWSIVREMVQTVIENHQNLIVEGCYIPFSLERGFFPAIPSLHPLALSGDERRVHPQPFSHHSFHCQRHRTASG